MKYYIISGEASGDLHGSNLIKALSKLDDNAEFRCWGGEMMQQQGATLVKHYKDLAFMGFVEVIRNLPTILNNLSFCKKDITDYCPDVIILVDYPGFNLRIAKWAKENTFKVVYYISPQIWAWKENRIHAIKKCIDKMLVILPFEKAFYSKWNYPVEYVGHPLVEVIEDYKKSNTSNHNPLSTEESVIALLPGSRKQEILKKLPIMLEVCGHFTQYQFVVAMAPGIDAEFYTSLLTEYKNVKAVRGKTYDLLSIATAALVTSGTATLETALFEVPEIICYKGSKVSYWIAKKLIKIKFIGLVNLIMNKEVVKELIQDELTPANLIKELSLMLNDDTKKEQIKKNYSQLKALLSEGGHASSNAASSIISFLDK